MLTIQRLRRSFLASICLTASAAHANSPVPAMPIGSPGAWATATDYPVPALAYRMTGVSAFRLAIDASGQPTGCEITQSSGFDLLDQTTCELLVQRARFSPATDAKGRPTTGSYSNRIRWVTPVWGNKFVAFESAVRLTIDRAGAVTSCAMIAGPAINADSLCRNFENISAAAGLEMRGSSAEPIAQVDVEMSQGYGKAPPERLLSVSADSIQRALAVFSFSLDTAAKLVECRIVQQRGSIRLVTNFCAHAGADQFEPLLGQVAADGSTTGWNVWRVVLKDTRSAKP